MLNFVYCMDVRDDFLTHVVESIQTPFYVIDVRDFTVVMANSAARALGVKGGGPKHTCYALTHRRDTPCDGLAHPCPLAVVQETKDHVTVEHIHYDQAGKPIHVEVHASPILDEAGNVAFMAEYSVDISARKEAETALLQANEALEELNRRKTQLLANLSHDIRSPLASVLGFTEMLQGGVYGALTPEQQGALKNISRSAEQLLNFVNNMLGHTQFEMGKLTVQSKQVLPAVLLASVEDVASGAADLQGIGFTAVIDPQLPDMLWGDPFWLRQILLNLIMNGVKFTKEGQVAVRFLRVDETTWAMQVADTGPGIPQEMWQDIFEPFRQVDGSDGHSERRGSGLGLAIVKQVTELMNGRVTVESEPGQGSIFTVTLPLILAGDENH